MPGIGEMRGIQPGQPIPAAWLNQIVRRVLRSISGGRGIRVDPMEGRLVITNTLMPAHRPISTGFVQVVSVSNDYLTCVWVDPPTSTTGDTVYVAKPFALMVSPFDGETVLYNNGQSVSYSYVTERQRGATSGAHEEIQSVTPDYFVGEELRVVSGETGALDFYGAWLVWQDLNTAGRHWAAEPT